MAKKNVDDMEWEDQESTGSTTPYQVEIPMELHSEVMAKSKEIGIKVAPFVREVFRMFRDTAPDQLFKKVQIANKGE